MLIEGLLEKGVPGGVRMGMVRDDGKSGLNQTLVVVGGYGGPCKVRSSKAINVKHSASGMEAGSGRAGAATPDSVPALRRACGL